MKSGRSLVLLVAVLLLGSTVFGQGVVIIPIATPIPGYYVFHTHSSQLILDTQAGSVTQSTEIEGGFGYPAPFWDTSGNQLAYYRGWDLYVDDPLGNGLSRNFPFSQTGFVFLTDWSGDGQAVLGPALFDLSSTSDLIFRLRLDTGQSEVVAEFVRQEPLPNGLVLVGLANFLDMNKVFDDWVAIIFAALPPERFELLVDSVSEDVPLLFNLETQQRIYLSEYLHESPAHRSYMRWSNDGRRVYLFEDSGWITELGFSPDGSVTPIASGQVLSPLPEDPEFDNVTLVDPVGVSDLFITLWSSIDSPNRYFRMARISEENVSESEWFTLNEDALNTEYISSGSFLLTADSAQQQALSCIIDVGPAARLQEGESGRVTITDGSGTRLRLEPGVTGDVLQTMPDGTPLITLNGPYCIDSMKWWQVQLADGMTGWAAEGSASGYFLEPAPVETATFTPTPTPPPTLTPTPAATATPAPFQRLRLTSLCSANPAAYRLWRIRNSNPYDVVFTWDVYRSPSGQNGFGVAPPAVNGVASEVIISTVTESGPNTMRLFVDGAQQDVKASSGATCPTPTPTP